MAAEEKYTDGVVGGGLGDYREDPAGFSITIIMSNK